MLDQSYSQLVASAAGWPSWSAAQSYSRPVASAAGVAVLGGASKVTWEPSTSHFGPLPWKPNRQTEMVIHMVNEQVPVARLVLIEGSL